MWTYVFGPFLAFLPARLRTKWFANRNIQWRAAAIATLTAPADQLNHLADISPLHLAASDPDGNTLPYSARNLPPGLVLGSASGIIAGRPTTVGSYPVTITASDGLTTDTKTFGWTIVADQPPTLDNPGAQTSPVGAPSPRRLRR